MDFYGIGYLENQANINYYIRYSLMLILLLVLASVLILFLKNRLDTKYRDLTVIAFLAFLVVVGVQYLDYTKQVSQTNQVSEMVNLVNRIAEESNVSKEEVVINSTQMNDQLIVKLKDSYYDIKFNPNKTAYTLTETNLITSQIIIKK